MSKTTRLSLIAALVVLFAGAVLLKEGQRSAGSPADPATASADDGRSVVAEPLPRLVDLGSTTCVPCKMMAPILEELQREYRGQFEVEFIDVRANRTAGELYGIRVIPTQIFLDAKGQERFRHEGFMSREDILGKWKELGYVFDDPVRAAPVRGES